MKTSLKYVLVLPLLFIFSPVITHAEENKNNQENLFKTLDKNSDGTITSDEISDDKNKFFDRLLRIGDKDDNGKLTKTEFMDAMNRKENPVASENSLNSNGKDKGKKKSKKKGKGNKQKRNPENLFKRLDKDKDGILADDELKPKGKGANLVKHLYKLLDKKPGDDITKEEFMSVADKFGRGKGKKQGVNQKKNKGGNKSKNKNGNKNKKQSSEKIGSNQGRRHHVPKFFELLDTNKDHSLSKEELSQASNLLNKLDKDNNGSLNPRELLGPPPGNRGMRGKKGKNNPRPGSDKNKKPGQNGLGKKGGKGKGFSASKRADKFVERFDKNDDDQLSSDEMPKKLKKNFANIDSDKNGFVSKEELANSFKKQGNKKRKSK